MFFSAVKKRESLSGENKKFFKYEEIIIIFFLVIKEKGLLLQIKIKMS